MDNGWILLAGAAAALAAIASIAFVWRARAGAEGGNGAVAQDGLLALGPALCVLGIVFSEDRAVGYSFIGGGVGISILAAVFRSHVSPS